MTSDGKIVTGIFGGSFNPVHVGHVALARQLHQMAGLDEVWLMVSPQNPLKRGRTDLLDDRLRFEMARTALAGEDGITASDYELGLPKPSYTWTTLTHLREECPNREFVLLIGGDNWQLFPRWYHADDILRHFRVVVYPRRGSEIHREQLPENVSVVDAALLDVSSTEIRQRVRQGQSITGLVPASIEAMVVEAYR